MPGACDPQQTAFSHLEPWTGSLESRRSHSEIKANRSEYGIWYLSSAMWNLEARNGFTSLEARNGFKWVLHDGMCGTVCILELSSCS